MAIVIGYAFADLVNEGIGVFMAFAVGVFPISGLQMLFRRLATRQLTIEEDADSRADQIIKLSGIDSAVSDRINSAGVTTIAQLAYCDPIQLAMQTNLTFSYIVDLVSQALAWVYLEERLAKIRGYGLRGALEIRTFSAELASDDPLVHQPARAALARIAEAADLPEEGLRVAFVQIAKDPYTEFLAKCW
jgi:hypothetical protein